ncbi:hypothetical protein Hypma_007019 [Hypsizygus marmoreus]|uniref:Uncharacterized protein n=1 Tax=Hypsizygus marmoreus TaxID=39966 RepID=A0A369K6Z6_HYPMA|nr:hypothetical protein Hypma_007019 [Hypsizygus marmoreus]
MRLIARGEEGFRMKNDEDDERYHHVPPIPGPHPRVMLVIPPPSSHFRYLAPEPRYTKSTANAVGPYINHQRVYPSDEASLRMDFLWAGLCEAGDGRLGTWKDVGYWNSIGAVFERSCPSLRLQLCLASLVYNRVVRGR